MPVSGSAPELGDIEVRPNTELLGEMPVTHRRTRAGDIDILFAIPSGPEGKPLGYCELQSALSWFRAADATIPVAALDDIVRSKEYANRDKDRKALPELRDLMRPRSTTGRANRQHFQPTRHPVPPQALPPVALSASARSPGRGISL
jgi:hypothetical protein